MPLLGVYDDIVSASYGFPQFFGVVVMIDLTDLRAEGEYPAVPPLSEDADTRTGIFFLDGLYRRNEQNCVAYPTGTDEEDIGRGKHSGV